VSTQSSSEIQLTFTGAVPVLPTTNISQATSFYGQLGFQILHQEAEYAIVKRDSVELHVRLCPDQSLAENSSCRIQVIGIEALYREYQSKGLLSSNAAVRNTPWGTKEFVAFDPDRVLITFVEHFP
jgi:catechol 2,3-dioxygenase-like lactoylglutathione lyase family enzyme